VLTDHTFLSATHNTTILNLLRKHSSDGTTRTRRHTSDIAYYSTYRPLKDERLSWLSWLTCSGRFTHISGHPSAAGRAWDRESSLVKDRLSNHCATLPTIMPYTSVPFSDSYEIFYGLWAVLCFHVHNSVAFAEQLKSDASSAWHIFRRPHLKPAVYPRWR